MSTVSNVLNNPDRVATETRRRVEDAMDRVGYVRNGAARQLRGAPSRVVGCVLLDTANPYYAALARGVEDRLAEAGCVLVQCSTDVRADREAQWLRLLQEQNVRGVLVSPVSARVDHLTALRAHGTPVVLLDRAGANAELCAAVVDNVAGGELAARHLLDLGHRRLAYARAATPVPSVTARAEGIGRALRAARLDPAEALVEVRVTGASTDEVAREVVAGLLGHRPRPTGVVCFNDATALALLRGLRQRGIAVPGEISVVGYDDLDFAAELSPSLTTVRQPTYQLGHAAADLLLSEYHPHHRHQRLVFAPELMVRDSTGAPAG
ncbi:substrate-binding domain-containing protein [Streptomyces sp. 3MP-14]|uniref:Substrate-binding domain-containing protein n=2 Tax=Streptomyces TaxID=1883 RepID=A0A5N6APE4_9ACTN|nr:substrate-binding domain-containing protein [Streptomyces mimosae]KAB8178740.1 substrate-binding domain-containing protein [Streptomyces sp. 3MP-14]